MNPPIYISKMDLTSAAGENACMYNLLVNACMFMQTPHTLTQLYVQSVRVLVCMLV